MTKTVLVIGASGFVGRYLCKMVQADGHNLQTYSYRYGQDVRNYEQLLGCIRQSQPHEIHYLAGLATSGSLFAERDIQTRVQGVVNLMTALRDTGSRAAVHYAGYGDEYDRSFVRGRLDDENAPVRPDIMVASAAHAAGGLAQTYGELYGIPVYVTRAWPHTGVGQSETVDWPFYAAQIAQIEAEGKGLLFLGSDVALVRWYSLQDVRDVVQAYRLLFDHRAAPGVYNIGDGPVLSGAEILRALIDVSGSTLETDRPIPGNPNRRMDGPNSFKLAVATGWSQEFTLEMTLTDLLTHYRDEQGS